MNTIDPAAPMPEWLEHAWLERYLERRLDDGERAAFESYVLDKPHLLDRIEADLDLRDGLVLAGERASAPMPASLVEADGPVIAHRPRRRPWRVPALAASIAVAFGAGFLLHGGMGTYGDDALIADPTRIVIDSARGAPSGPRVENPESASAFVLIDALVPADAEYVAVRGARIGERRLTVSKDGVATLLLRRDDLGRMGPLTLVIRSAGREYERPLQLTPQ
jgi:hypothetical protein